MKDKLITAIIGTQCALSGEVPSNLRAVTVDVDSVKGFFIDFYYEGVITEDIDASASSIVMEASCVFHPFFPCTDREIRLDPPSEIPRDKTLVYLRNEKHVNHQSLLSNAYFTYKSAVEDAMILSSVDMARLAAIPALLGKITPQLRAVKIDSDETSFGMHFIYHGEISEEDRLLALSAIEEFGKYIPKGYEKRGTIERLDYPERIPFIAFAYYKKEPTTEIMYVGS
jgi:hypothetical protein